MKLGIVTAAAILVAGTMFAAAQQGSGGNPSKKGEETGMPSDAGQKTGTVGKGTGTAPKTSEKNKQPSGAPSDKPPEGADSVKPK